MYLFAPAQPAATVLTDESKADGCFSGVTYYTRVPAGTVAYRGIVDAFADFTGIMGSKYGAKNIKIDYASLDMTGSWEEKSNLLGPTLKTECGSFPPVYKAMENNATLLFAARKEWARAPGLTIDTPIPGGPNAFGLHNMEPYILSFPLK